MRTRASTGAVRTVLFVLVQGCQNGCRASNPLVDVVRPNDLGADVTDVVDDAQGEPMNDARDAFVFPEIATVRIAVPFRIPNQTVFTWDGDAQCAPMPTPQAIPAFDAACSDACTTIAPANPLSALGTMFGDRGHDVELGNNAGLYRVPADGGQPTRYWNTRPDSGLSPFCPHGLASALTVYPTSSIVACVEAMTGAWDIYEIEPDSHRFCSRYAGLPAIVSPSTPPFNVRRIQGGLAWLQSWAADTSNILFETNNAREASSFRCIAESMAGGDDVIVFVSLEYYANATVMTETVWVSYAPFTQATLLWNPHISLSSISSDPDNPHHLVLVGGVGDPSAIRQSDVYYIDLDHWTGAPQQLTHDAPTQLSPVIRGDRVAYDDFADDTLNPTGSIVDAHNAIRVAVMSISTGSRTVVAPGVATGIVWLGTDRVYFATGGGTAMTLLPP